jgi:hypothetical protein
VLLAMAIATPLIGLLLLALGLRGRRVNDHPVCAHCGFDLIGLTGPSACPECGKRLDTPRAVRMGARRKRPAFIATGAGLLVLMVLAGSVLLTGSTLDRYKPSWLLMLECRFRPPERVSAMLSELIARSDRNELRNSARAALARRALLAQSTDTPPWSREWSLVLADPAFGSLLGPREQDAAAAAGSNLKLAVRRLGRTGQGLPINITHSVTDRFLQPGRTCVVHDVGLVIRDGGGRVVYEWSDPTPQNYNTMLGSTYGRTWTAKPDIAPGTYQVQLSCVLRIPGAGPGGPVEQPVSVAQDVTIVPADQPVVELVHDPEAGALFAKSVLLSVDLSKYGNGDQWAGLSMGFRTGGADDDALKAWTQAQNVKFKYRTALIDSKGKEVPAGTVGLSLLDTGWMLSPGGAVVPSDFVPGRYKLRLTPDIKAAEESIDDLRIVGEPVEMDIDVSRSPQSTRALLLPAKK